MRQQIMKGSEMIADYENSTREARDKIFAAAQQELQINVQKSLSRYGRIFIVHSFRSVG